MTKQEFETLTNGAVSAAEFERANMMYMAASDMDKEEFCQCWKNGDTTAIMDELLKNIEAQEVRLAQEKRAGAKAMHDVTEMADTMLRKADEYDDDELKIVASRIVGIRAAVLVALKYGLNLNRDEKEYIAKNLK